MASARTIDFRSDFLAHPTDAMLEAYRAAAKTGAYGLREDPRQRELEAAIAKLLGCEDALVFPTCTMANLTAVLLHTAPGQVLVCQDKAHVLTAEAGGAAAFGGVVIRPVPGESVEAPLDLWLAAAEPATGSAQTHPALCWIENTHNRLGGAAASASYCRALADSLRAVNPVRLHLDGSRILYAAAALGVPAAELAAPFDTVSISLNKGLGSAMPAALAGSKEAMGRAEAIRQRLGGGMRPVAAAAAAALVALADVGHLREDIRRAKAFALRLQSLPALRFLPVASNLVFFDVNASTVSAAQLVERCAARGVLLNSPAPGRVRVVFYRGITDEDVDRAVDAVERAVTNKE